MSVGLLDVNVLIALAWPSHIHHSLANTWFSHNQSQGWATCPHTECAFVRLSTNPKFIREAIDFSYARSLLKDIKSQDHHVFWPDDQTLEKALEPMGFLAGHRQVTDAYLLGLSIHNQGRFVTLDQKVASLLPDNSPHRENLEIVSTEE